METQSIFWPGTKTPKSSGNAFDWKNRRSSITTTTSFRNSQNATQGTAKSMAKKQPFTIYTKARAAK